MSRAGRTLEGGLSGADADEQLQAGARAGGSGCAAQGAALHDPLDLGAAGAAVPPRAAQLLHLFGSVGARGHQGLDVPIRDTPADADDHGSCLLAGDRLGASLDAVGLNVILILKIAN
jgi:hypothetical protein